MHGHHRPSKKEAIMDTARNKDLARRLYALINEARVDQVADLISPDYYGARSAPRARLGPGRRNRPVLDDHDGSRAALHCRGPDHRGRPHRCPLDERGTHVGEFAGIPPTGRTFTIAGIDIYRVADGQLCEHWHVIDQLGDAWAARATATRSRGLNRRLVGRPCPPKSPTPHGRRSSH